VNPDQLLAPLKRLGSTLTPRQLATLAAAFVGVVGVVAGSAYWMNTPSYTLLYADLDPESANAVVAKLKTAKIDYVLDDGGRAVRVPMERVDELRLDMAAQGLPTTGRIGFEIFDRTAFGTTEFLEQVNFRRGLEGELGRTIGTIAEVASARVHIALPKASLFTGDNEQAKASVVLKLRNNKPLAPSTVAGIAGLVAASVESLRPESVVIIDTFGRPLSQRAGAEDEATGGQPLERLHLAGCSNILDVAVLQTLPLLRRLILPPNATNIGLLRSLTNLEQIGFSSPLPNAADFWAEFNAPAK